MKVHYDSSQTEALAERATEVFREMLPRAMDSAVKLAAQYELDHKTYVDRTKDLRNNTRGYAERGGGDVRAVFEMDTEYASYVNRRGFSSFNEAGILARDTTQDFVDSIQSEIGR